MQRATMIVHPPALLVAIACFAVLELARQSVFTRTLRSMHRASDDGASFPTESGLLRGGTNATALAKDDDGGADRCLLSLPDCDLSCLDWTIVLATGRSGSTTVLQMMAELPDMNFYGEEGGLLAIAKQFQDRVAKSKKHTGQLAWLGAKDADARTVACMTQKFYAERHGTKCLDRGCRHGWKEIRYTSPKMIAWIRKVFPTSKLILNYRGTCPDGYKDVFNRGCDTINNETSGLLKATKNLKGVFHLETEQLNNLTKWGAMAEFLGYEGCEAKKVANANTKHGYSRVKQRARDLWKCS